MLRWPCTFGMALLFPTFPDATDLVPFTVIDGVRIESPLSEQAGDWREGQRLYFDEKLTGCSVCHGSPDDQAAETREDIPALAGIRSRLSDGEIRLWIVAPNVIDPETQMPGFYLPGQRPEADAPVINGPRLSAQQIEDLIAYLVRWKDSE